MIEKKELLKEVLNDKILYEIQSDRIITLKESDKGATLKEAVVDAGRADYIILRPDKVSGLDSIFKKGKGQLKNCDYLIFFKKDKDYFSVFIELKSGLPKEDKYLSQFKGSMCLLEYIDVVLKKFYEERNFFENFKTRYVVLHKASIDKQPTRIDIKSKNDSPEKARLLKVRSEYKFRLNEFL